MAPRSSWRLSAWKLAVTVLPSSRKPIPPQLLIQAVLTVVLNLADKQPQTAEQWTGRLTLMAQLADAIVVSFAFIGQVRGWMHGTFRDLIVCVVVGFWSPDRSTGLAVDAA
jgi:hypothetical protein